MTPSKQKGAISGGKYREYITSFKMSGNDAQGAFNTISNTDDPKQVTDYRLNSSSGWTDGQFEFIAFMDQKHQTLVNQIKKAFLLNRLIYLN